MHSRVCAWLLVCLLVLEFVSIVILWMSSLICVCLLVCECFSIFTMFVGEGSGWQLCLLQPKGDYLAQNPITHPLYGATPQEPAPPVMQNVRVWFNLYITYRTFIWHLEYYCSCKNSMFMFSKVFTVFLPVSSILHSFLFFLPFACLSPTISLLSCKLAEAVALLFCFVELLVFTGTLTILRFLVIFLSSSKIIAASSYTIAASFHFLPQFIIMHSFIGVHLYFIQ